MLTAPAPLVCASPMNRTDSATRLSPGPLVLTGLIFIAALSRVLPHPPNFSPVEAIALFGGAYFASRRLAILVPLIGMLLSDLTLALFNGGLYLQYLISVPYLAVYACIVLSALLGFGLRGKVDGTRVLGYSLAGSLLFFLVTNFAVWATANPLSGHPACSIGLLACYAAGIPFLQWTLLGTLFYSALLFGGFAMLRHRLPALRKQTV